MPGNSSWNLRQSSRYLRSSLFILAARRHVKYATWASDGQGVDRHLFGLKKMLKEGEPLPEIFSDPAFGRSSHWELSTSQLSSRYLDGWGYGEGKFWYIYIHIYIFVFFYLFSFVPLIVFFSYSGTWRLWSVLFDWRRPYPLDDYKHEVAHRWTEKSTFLGCFTGYDSAERYSRHTRHKTMIVMISYTKLLVTDRYLDWNLSQQQLIFLC